MKILMKYHRDLVLRKGLLYRKVQLKNQSDIVFQFVLPKTFQKKTVLAFSQQNGTYGNGPNVSSSSIQIFLAQNVLRHNNTH